MKTTPPSTSAWLYVGLFAFSAFFTISLWDITSSTPFGENDFMAYWSSTYLFSHGKNPYSLELMAAVQQTEVHSKLDATIMSWNPPTLFVFLLPLAWLSFPAAKFVWLLVNFLFVLTAALMLIQIYLPTVSPRIQLIFVTFAIVFPAVIAGLYMGQVTFLVFWGLVACLALVKQKQWFWAGALMILMTIKPQLTILSGMYLFLYMAKYRRWQGWIGLAAAGTACLIIVFFFRPGLLADLQGGTAVTRVPWATSTIGGLLGWLGITEAARYLILLFLPLPFILVRYSETLRVELSIALLTLITVPTTFFGWSYDQTILLIPIAQVFAWLVYSKYRWPVIASIAVAMAVNYYQRLLIINETYYVWVPIFWWVIFGVVWHSISLTSNNHAFPKLQSFINRRFR